MNKTNCLALALLIPALSACSPATADRDAILAGYSQAVDGLNLLVSDHVAAVDAAPDLDSISTLELAYASDWQAAMGDLDQAMTDLAGCDMDNDAMGMWDSATAMTDAMTLDVTDHVAAHQDHSDIEQCATAEVDDQAMMSDGVDQMMSWHDSWEASDMSCGMGDMGSMGDMGASGH